MPQARKPATPASRARTAFKEPAAMKRLNKSLDSARDALAELSKSSGRDASKGARDLYKDLRTFLTSARRHTGRLASALERDYERAQKQLSADTGGRSRAAAGGRRAAPRTAAKRTTAKRGTAKRGTAKR
jgi:hypothetical protein